MERVRRSLLSQWLFGLRLCVILALFVGMRPVYADSPPTPPTDFELFRTTDNKWVFQVTGFKVTGTPTTVPGTQTYKYAGLGTLNVHIAGINVPPVSVPLQYVVFDASGKVTGFDLKPSSDHTYKNILSTGLDVTFPANSDISLSASGGLTIIAPAASGTAGKIALPFKNTDGSALTLELKSPPASAGGGAAAPAFQITPTGALTLSASAPTLSVRLPGFIVSGKNAALTLTHLPNQATYDDYTVTADTVELDAPIPGVFSSRRDPDPSSAAATAAASAGAAAGSSTGGGKDDTPPLHLSVSMVSFDSDGQFTFSGAHFDASQGGGVVLADLPALGGFYLNIKKADLSMTKSVVTSFDMTADVHLPDDFSSDEKVQKPAVIAGLSFTAHQGILASTKNAPNSGGVNLYWNRLGLSADNVILDLSSGENGDANGIETDDKGVDFPKDWKGLYLKNALLVLPDDFTAGGTADRVKVAAKYAYISPQGFTGDIQATDVPNIKLDGFNCSLTKVAVVIEKNSLKTCDITATLMLEDLDNKPVNAEVGFTSAGNVNVALSTPQPITLDSLHLTAKIDSGTFALDQNNNWKVKLTGAFAADDGVPDFLDGLAFRVKDLTFNSEGHFDFDPGGELWVTLPDAAELPLGPIDIQLTEIGFGKSGTNDPYPNRYWIGFSSNVDITGLPLQVSSQFAGVKIFKPAAPGGSVDFNLGAITVDASVDGIVSFHGSLSDNPTITRTNGTKLTVPTPMLNGKPMHILTGSAALQIPALGAGGGFSTDFMVGQSCWFVMCGVGLPAPIPLGQTGIGLYGFIGGVGYNVVQGTGIPMRDYIPAPDVNAIQSGQSSKMFVAGVRAGQVPVPALWGDLVVVFHMPNIVADIAGGLSVLNVPPTPSAQIPADFSKLDRVFTGGIHYDAGQDLLHANLIGDLNFPTRAKPLLSAYEDCELNLQSGNSYFRIGDGLHYSGDVFQVAGHPDIRKQVLDSLAIDHPAHISLTLPTDHPAPGVTITVSPIQGILDADITHKQLRAALIFDSGLNATGSVKAGVTISWDANLTLSARGLIAVNWDNNNRFQAAGAFRLLAQGKVNASALSGHVKAGLDATIEGDLDGVVSIGSNAASLQMDGDLDADLALHVPWYGDVKFHIAPHVSEGVSL